MSELELTLKRVLDAKYGGSIATYCKQAAEAGMPRDQIEFFLSIGYIAVPSMLPFHASARKIDSDNSEPNEILTGGSRGGSKSHSSMMQIADDCHRNPNSHFLFLRKTQKVAKESMEQIIGRTLKYCDHTYQPANRKVSFPNGSSIILGGFNQEKDVDDYLSLEYDGIGIEEVTQLTQRKVESIYGSIRTSKPGIRTHKYFTTNPGGIGHRYIKEKFILPWRTGSEKTTRFFPSNYRDNPFLDVDYVNWLENLRGALGKAWRDGDWDVFEGQAFAFSYDRHVKSSGAMTPGDHWTEIRGIDWGSNAPFCCLWAKVNPDNGRIWVHRELYVSREQGDIPLTDTQQAMRVIAMTPANEKVSITYADPSMWNKKTADMASDSASVYAMNGLYLVPGDNDRIGGKRRIDRLMADLPDGEPGLLISETCQNLIQQLSDLVYAEGTEDVDQDQEDHAYDCLRYLTSSSRVGGVLARKSNRKPILSPFEMMVARR
jgi:phage terminase large subunit